MANRENVDCIQDHLGSEDLGPNFSFTCKT